MWLFENAIATKSVLIYNTFFLGYVEVHHPHVLIRSPVSLKDKEVFVFVRVLDIKAEHSRARAHDEPSWEAFDLNQLVVILDRVFGAYLLSHVVFEHYKHFAALVDDNQGILVEPRETVEVAFGF